MSALMTDLTGVGTQNEWKTCTNIFSTPITIFRSAENNYNRVGTISLGQTTTKAYYSFDNSNGEFKITLQDSTKNINNIIETQNRQTDVFLWTGIRNPISGCASGSFGF